MDWCSVFFASKCVKTIKMCILHIYTQLCKSWCITVAKNSASLLMHLQWKVLSMVPDLKTKLFLCRHKCHMPIGNRIFHGIPRQFEISPVLQLVSIHSSKGRLNDSSNLWGTFKLCQNCWATLQPLSKWSIDSLLRRQRDQMGLRLNPLEPKTSQVGTLLWKHSQIKNWIWGKDSIFQSQSRVKVNGFKGFKPLARR